MKFKVGDKVKTPEGAGIVVEIDYKDKDKSYDIWLFNDAFAGWFREDQLKLIPEKQHNVIDGWMYFTPFDDMEEVGQYIGKKVRYGDCYEDVTNKNKASSLEMLSDISDDPSEPFIVFTNTWRYIGVPLTSQPKKVKVAIDGKEGYISQESAEELKRMLS